MGEQQSPPFRRRRLGKVLRRLRESAGLSLDETSERLEISRSRLWRFEVGEAAPEVVLVKALLDVYGVPVDAWEPYLQVAREARLKGWWQAYGLPAMGYVAVEAAASGIQDFALAYVPGLLQTEPYIRAVLATAPLPRSDEEFERQVAVRRRRQRRLTDPEDGLRLDVVIDEGVLLRPIGGTKVMRDQLEYLAIAAELPDVTLQVLPTAVGAQYGMMGAFTVLSFAESEEGDIAYVAHVAGSVQMEKEEPVRECRLTFTRLRDQALSPEDSVALIERIAAPT